MLRATTASTFSTSQLPKVVRQWCVSYILISKCASCQIFSISQLPKVVRTWCVFYILTSKCDSRHNGVHFFDISTSKRGPTTVCFVYFNFEMCFAPHFFDISISERGPNPSIFDRFYFQICFAPQRHATFHLSSPQMSPHPPL